MDEFKGKTILVTGGTGTIGSELVRQLLQCEPKQIRVFSRNDTRQYELRESLGYPHNLRMLIGDIRDKDRLDLAFRGVDYIFHAAALKHVPLCEYNPFEAVKTNIIGSQNVIDAAIKHGVKKVIAVSTDKAANPTNTMGVSKLMMERLFLNTNFFTRGDGGGTILSCVRFGNVAWASGSVLPLWDRQVREKGAIRITNKNMTRFLMSIPQAANLVLRAAELAVGGEIFVLKMPSVKIANLAKMFLKKYHPGKKIKLHLTGDRPGEKMHECLIGDSEKYQQIFSGASMFIVAPEPNPYEPKEKFSYTYPGFKKVQGLSVITSRDLIDHKRISELI